MRFYFILIAILLTACGREPLYQSQSYVFGTLVDVSIYGEDEARARELSKHVLQDFQKLHDQLHAWQEESELSQLNTDFAAGKTRNISHKLAGMIRHATTLSKQSEGVFNPAIGKLIEKWGFQRDTFSATKIDNAAINHLVSMQPSMADIQLDTNALGDTATSTNPAVKLDLGGYAKGYALDAAAKYLREQGVKNALINIGGNIIAIGKHGKQAWRVGIQHPRKAGPIATLALADGWAIGTSGDYQRYFELDGKRYCHIINPKTGYPAQGTQAVTILVPPSPQAGTLSDVASKPIFIVEASQKAAAAARMNISNYLMIDSDGKIFTSPAMAERLQWVDANK